MVEQQPDHKTTCLRFHSSWFQEYRATASNGDEFLANASCDVITDEWNWKRLVEQTNGELCIQLSSFSTTNNPVEHAPSSLRSVGYEIVVNGVREASLVRVRSLLSPWYFAFGEQKNWQEIQWKQQWCNCRYSLPNGEFAITGQPFKCYAEFTEQLKYTIGVGLAYFLVAGWD